MASDSELLGQFLDQRNEAAFRQLVDRHLPAVYSSALRQVAGDRHLAQDVSQRVFSALAAKARTVADKPSLAGWLCKAARYEAAHAVREAQRRRAREWEAHPELMGPAELQAEWERLRPVIDEILCAMPEEDREVVLLRFFHNLDYPAIGARLGKSADAVRLRADRALEKMRKRLRRAGIDSASAAIALALANRTEAAPAEMAAQITAASISRAAAGKIVAGTGAASTGAAAGWVASAAAVGAALLALTFAVRKYPQTVQVRQDATAAAFASAAQAKELAQWRGWVAHQRDAAQKAENDLASLRQKLRRPESPRLRPKFTPAQSQARDATLAALSKDPTIRRDFEEFWTSFYMDHYGPFLRAHGFSAGEIANAVSVKIHHDDGYGMMGVQVNFRSDSESDAQADQAIHQSLSKLSSEDFTVFRQDDSSGLFVQALAGALADSPDGLSGEQGRRLADLIAKARPPLQPGESQSDTLESIDWASVQAKAQNFLSPPQQDTLAAEAALGAAGMSFNSDHPGETGAWDFPSEYLDREP